MFHNKTIDKKEIFYDGQTKIKYVTDATITLSIKTRR